MSGNNSGQGGPRAGRKYLLLILLAFCVFPAMAQESEESAKPAMTQELEQSAGQPSRGLGFFIAPLTEVTGHGRNSPSLGFGFALGSDDGVALGLRCLYTFELNSTIVNALELTVFLRWYLHGALAYSGPFIQFTGGTVLYAVNESVSVPAGSGMLSAGLGFGWRFPLGKYWFLEPAVRAGYPYIYGAGVSIALRV